MNLDKLLIVASKSRYEVEIAKHGSEAKAKRWFAPDFWEKLRRGHKAQKWNLAKVKNQFDNDKILLDRNDLTTEVIKQYDAFVFLGGDNHFTYCSQLLLRYMQENSDAKKQVLGTVLDPARSWGGQLYFNVDSLFDYLPKLEQDQFILERWSTLETEVRYGDGVEKMYHSINEIFAGETKRWNMSRNILEDPEGKEFPDKSSGILVVAGAGSGPGSWYNNVHRVAFDCADEFGKEERCARVFATEHESKAKSTFSEGQVLSIYSSNDDQGVILPDCHEDKALPFNIGAEARIRIGDIKLPVIRPL